MTRGLGLVIVVVGCFMGFLIGYSLSPMMEVGMIGAKKEQVGIQTDVNEDMQEYYDNLLKE